MQFIKVVVVVVVCCRHYHMTKYSRFIGQRLRRERKKRTCVSISCVGRICSLALRALRKADVTDRAVRDTRVDMNTANESRR